MSFKLTDEQKALQAGIRDFCTDRVSIERVTAIGEAGFDRDLWREIAAMGVFHAQIDGSQADHGVGAGEAAIVFAELGRALAPGPLVWTHLAAGIVDGAGTGETVVGGLDLTAERAQPYVIEHLASLDVLLLIRRDGVFRVDPRTVETKPVPLSLDPLTPVAHATALPAGDRVADADRAHALQLAGTALTASFLLGIADATHEMAVAYAKVREQFGRTIGSFQAIKHLLADSFVRVQVARASVYGAAATLEHPEVGDVDRAVSGAKINAGEAAWRNARTCIQVHGGMGYTWEIPAHYYAKRAWVLSTGFGSAEEHAARIGDCVGDSSPASEIG